MVETAGAVLDASALLAFLQGEPGAQIVEEAIPVGAAINVVNYAEVLSRLSDTGAEPETVHRHLRAQGLIGGLLALMPLDEDDAVTLARLRPLTRTQGLSLGDRACLATGPRLGRPVMTADRGWEAVDVGVPVRLIRL
jgi:PIN domain nuclease of toxin-antitoxin system